MRGRVAFLALCMLPCTLLRLDAGASERRRPTPTAPAEYLERVNPVAPSPQAFAEAKTIYERECKKCHGSDGRGRGSATRGMTIKPPDYTNASSMNARADGQLAWIILNGSDPDTTEMSAFDNKLSEDDAWKLVLFIREFSRTPVVAADTSDRQ